MSKKISRSFGAMETWEPPDKSFSKHTLQEGTGDLSPNEGSVCNLNLMAIGEDNIDESLLGGYKFGEDCEVTIGEGDTFFSGLLDTVVMSMKEGERCYIKSKYDLYGNKHGELEAAHSKASALKFNVHLYSFNRAADLDDLEADEQLERAQHHKDKGTELFKLGKVDYALKRYQNAVQYVLAMEPIGDLPQSLIDQHDTLKCQCYLNLAACRSKSDSHEDVIDHCTRALAVEPGNVKGLFRRGQAYCKLHKYAEAKADLSKALELEPENKAVVNLLRTIDANILKEKQMYKKMFT